MKISSSRLREQRSGAASQAPVGPPRTVTVDAERS